MFSLPEPKTSRVTRRFCLQHLAVAPTKRGNYGSGESNQQRLTSFISPLQTNKKGSPPAQSESEWSYLPLENNNSLLKL